jgi:hypothetical protein
MRQAVKSCRAGTAAVRCPSAFGAAFFLARTLFAPNYRDGNVQQWNLDPGSG